MKILILLNKSLIYLTGNKMLENFNSHETVTYNDKDPPVMTEQVKTIAKNSEKL